jgi:hypothetical protein
VIDSARLVNDLKKQLKLLEADLRQRADDPETPWAEGLHLEYERAFARERTAHTWSEWSAGELSQAAVAWIVSSTFIRFCEDNDLLVGASIDGAVSSAPWIAGPGDRLARAVEHQTTYFRANPTLTARDWLVQPFRALAALPAGRGLLDPEHSPVWSITISAAAAEALLNFWRAPNPDGSLAHDFTDLALGTRFLGDIYQDLSDYAKKTYALLQTPIFVEEFILDRTLTPAMAEFGIDGLKLIDPTCGSGHFLLGAFERLVEAWREKAPAMDARTRVQTALNSIHGVDLNPFAVAIARFRLTVAALLASGERSLVSAPAFGFKLAVGDSLLRWKADDVTLDLGDEEETFAYSTEDIREYAGLLDPNQYHVVVGNPPYIQVKDKALNEAYRRIYKTCKGKYALSVPFMELFFELALTATESTPAGYVGKITSNSFMKREFGTKVIEEFLSGYQEFTSPVDLTAVVDTSGAYIPGHGTPTVILFGRRRRKQGDTVRAALGVRGEPGQPADPAHGLVWRDIVDHLDEPGYNGTYVTITDLPRETLAAHPWSLSGGGAGELKAQLDSIGEPSLPLRTFRIGVFGIMGSDDAFMNTESVVRRDPGEGYRRLVLGDVVRDYRIREAQPTFFPYDAGHNLLPLPEFPEAARRLWRLRSELGNRATFSRLTYFKEGRPWYEWHQLPKDENAHKWQITFAFVATHNHFVLDRGGKVFNRSAPVIKLPADATEDDHLELLGVLNSSTACFWLKQVSHNKGGPGGGSSKDEKWRDFYEFTSTNLAEFPLPAGSSAILERARVIQELAESLGATTPAAVLQTWSAERQDDLGGVLASARAAHDDVRGRLVFEQEELDWEVYSAYGLVDDEMVSPFDATSTAQLKVGERPFEILLAQAVESGLEKTRWFADFAEVQLTAISAQVGDDTRTLMERRIAAIRENSGLALLENPNCKRAWNYTSWDIQLREALTTFILNRLEARELWAGANGRPVIRSVAQIAEAVKNDADLRSAITLLTGDAGANIQQVIASLIADEAVPAAAPQRYKPTGVVKFREWQKVWNLQRAEDRGDRVTIPVPPKYAPTDFAKTTYWKARGKLDVPKERFIAFIGARRSNDDTAVYGWAGWNHAEQGLAASSLLVEMAGAGANTEQLMPVFAALIELEPWIAQWHSEVDPAYGVSPATAVTGVVDNQLARAGFTRDDVDAWSPAANTRGRRLAASTVHAKPTAEDTP